MSDQDQERTYSIWPFVAVFVVLGTVGLVGILMFGSPSTPTETIPSFTTTTEAPTSTGPDGGAAEVTVPGGDPAPDGVRDVVVDGDVTSYAFGTPESLASEPLRAFVARARATPDAAGTAIELDVSCTTSADEAIAQISVTATPTSITVLPVVIAPASGGAACTPGTAPLRITLPLTEPVGGRAVVLVPAGTEVPPPGP